MKMILYDVHEIEMWFLDNPGLSEIKTDFENKAKGYTTCSCFCFIQDSNDTSYYCMYVYAEDDIRFFIKSEYTSDLLDLLFELIEDGFDIMIGEVAKTIDSFMPLNFGSDVIPSPKLTQVLAYDPVYLN